jgi:alcohol dehydrogenase (cytochrome c)
MAKTGITTRILFSELNRKITKSRLTFATLLIAFLLLSLQLVQANYSSSQSAQPTYANWSSPGYNNFNTDYDPQNVINSANVNQLQVSWVYQVPENPYNIPGTARSLGIETTPLVVSGYVYFATPYNLVIALNSNTGTVLWEYQVNMSKFVSESWWAPAYNERSLTYYNGTIYFTASDTAVYGLNAVTGQLVFSLPPIAANIPGNNGQYYGELAPVVYDNLLIVRASTTDYGGRGFVSAYNIDSKQLVWTWYSMPGQGGNSSWDTLSCSAGCTGNVAPYSDDWGNSSLIGGSAAWGLMAIDSNTGVAYLSLGHPSDVFDASLRPGPNLYSDSVVALNLTNGQLIWYYQINSHDITEHEGGWAVTLANATINGQTQEVVIQAAKNNYVYVLNAATGKLVYSPIQIGSPAVNSPNDDEVGSAANLTQSQSTITNEEICPGPDGGVEMTPGFANNTLFVASQNACGIMYAGTVTYKGSNINGYIYQGDEAAAENATIYAINIGTGKVDWSSLLTDRYQGSAIVVSGGVVYAVDRAGTLYAFSESTGSLLRSISLGGVGAAGVAIGENLDGQMMVFVPAGGADIPTATPGVLLGLTVPQTSVSGTVTSTNTPTNQNLLEAVTAGLAIVVVALSLVILTRRSRAAAPAAAKT